MAKYITRIEAPKAAYPVLLGNGNLKEKGDLPGGDRHYAVWDDPFPKPCYLFALVAGNLCSRERVYRTGSGKDVTLRIFVAENNISKVGLLILLSAVQINGHLIYLMSHALIPRTPLPGRFCPGVPRQVYAVG